MSTPEMPSELVSAFGRIRSYLEMRGLHLPAEPKDIQADWSLPFVRWVAGNTTSGVKFNLPDSDPPGIRIGTHRDIVCDPALYNLGRVDAGRPTTHIVLGSNLAGTPWVRALLEANKAIFIDRSLNGRAALMQHRQLSEKIATIVQGGGHVWIAQGPGRSKDGRDETSASLLRMLGLAWGGEEKGPESLNGLLRPVVIRYDLNPCDAFLVREKLQGFKAEGDDEESMKAGLEGWKGQVQCAEGEAIWFDSNGDRVDWQKAAEEVNRSMRALGISGKWAHEAENALGEGDYSHLSESFKTRTREVEQWLHEALGRQDLDTVSSAMCEVYREVVRGAVFSSDPS